MAQTTQQTMTCAACGLRYPWSVPTAGKKVKCKCGAVFVAPASAEGVAEVVSAAPPRMAVSTGPPPMRNAESARAASADIAAPTVRVATAVAPPAPAKVDDALEDDDAGMYDIAGDVEAPAPLSPVGPPVPHAAPAAKRDGAKTGGAKTGGAKKSPGRAGTPAFPGYAAKKVDDTGERKAEIKKLLIIGGGVAVLVVAVILLKTFVLDGGGSGGADKYANLPGEDGTFSRMRDDDGAHEAKAWLTANPSRGIVGFEWTRDKTARKIDEWYAAGAKNVFAFGQSVFTASLAIELPDDPAKRKTFVDYAEQFRKDRGQVRKAPVTDVGQKFVILEFMQTGT